MLLLMVFACVIIITSFINHTRTADQGQIPSATIFLNKEQYRPPRHGPWGGASGADMFCIISLFVIFYKFFNFLIT